MTDWNKKQAYIKSQSPWPCDSNFIEMRYFLTAAQRARFAIRSAKNVSWINNSIQRQNSRWQFSETTVLTRRLITYVLSFKAACTSSFLNRIYSGGGELRQRKMAFHLIECYCPNICQGMKGEVFTDLCLTNALMFERINKSYFTSEMGLRNWIVIRSLWCLQKKSKLLRFFAVRHIFEKWGDQSTGMKWTGMNCKKGYRYTQWKYFFTLNILKDIGLIWSQHVNL